MKFTIFLCMILTVLQINAQTKPKTNTAKPTPKTEQKPKADTVKTEKIVAPAGKDVVAVYHFTSSRQYSYDYAVGVGNAVEAGFVRSTRFTVVERNRFGTIKEEDKFKEANTSDLVDKASRFGAKTIVTGHVVGVSYGDVVDSYRRPTGEKFCEISLSFKIIDVESGEIKLSETIRGTGNSQTDAGAIQNAYIAIDGLVRRYIAWYLPQRFKFMNVVSKTTKKKVEYLDVFKIWGGSDDGLKVGDAVDVYTLSYVTNPSTGKQIEEKKLLAYATITEVNSGSTATCRIESTKQASKFNVEILNMAVSQPDKIIVESSGTTITKPKSFWDIN